MITVMTAILGHYDNLREQPASDKARYVCFSDGEQPDVEPWRIQPAFQPYQEAGRNSRIPKILAHLFADTEFSIWQDGTMQLTKDPWEPVSLLGDADLALIAHPCRKCVYHEAEICLCEGIGNQEEISRMVEAYRAEGFPENAGLYCGGVIVRRNTPAMQAFNERWWSEFQRFDTFRDQFSLAYTIYKMQPKMVVIPGDHQRNPYWRYNYHAAFRDYSDNAIFEAGRERLLARYVRLQQLCAEEK